MATRTPNEEREQRNIPIPISRPGKTIRRNSASTGLIDDGGGDTEDDDDDDAAQHVGSGLNSGKAKKKRKHRKKKKKKDPASQTDPPSVLIADLFKDGIFPKGEEVAYMDNLRRVTQEEQRHADKFEEDFLNDYRHAAETHRQVRHWAQEHIKPGQTLLEIADGIENGVRRLVGHDGLSEGDARIAGMGFPLGLNIDDVAAHYSPNASCKKVLQENNVLKVDIGVHVHGRIVDSAFTMAFNPAYDNLLAAVKDGTDTGLREAGIDVRLGELGGHIQEAMESYECEIGGVTYPIRPIRNLTGHTVLPYSIHGTKAVPSVKTDDMTKMEEGDVFAIETFGSTGRGYAHESGECSHYALKKDHSVNHLHISSAKSILRTIESHFGTLPFCRRYLDRLGQDRYLFGLNHLVKSGIVEAYPPLVDVKGSYTAQFEHTVLLRATCKEVISRGHDY